MSSNTIEPTETEPDVPGGSSGSVAPPDWDATNSHHGDGLSEQLLDDEVNVSFPCPECLKEFPSKRSLGVHSRAHKKNTTVTPQAAQSPSDAPHAVHVIGFTGHRTQAPWGRVAGVEWWGCNALYASPGVPWEQFQRWFDPHPPETFTDGHKVWLAEQATQRIIYVLAAAEQQYPGTVRLPHERLIAELGTDYWTNTISYMLGLAILEMLPALQAWKDWHRAAQTDITHDAPEPPQPELGIWGVDMATSCLVPGTRVLTEDLNWTEVEKIEAGDRLVSFDEYPGNGARQRQYRSGVVERVERLMKPCYEITLDDGRKITASAEHPWLTHVTNQTRWKRTDELVGPHHRPGRPTRIIEVFDVWGEDRSWEAGYLAAAFDGEVHSLTIGFAQRDNAMAAEVDNALSALGFDWGEGTDGDVRKYQLRGGRPEMVRFLGEVRPRRLLDKFDAAKLGSFRKRDTRAVVSCEYVGEREVIGFQVDTKTFIAEGLATHNTEYGAQRPSCELLIGMAMGLGFKITIPPESTLMKSSGMYGVSDDGKLRAQLLHRKEEISSAMMQIQGQRAQLANQLGQADGAIANHQGHLQEIEFFLNVWTMPGTGGNREAASLPGQLDPLPRSS